FGSGLRTARSRGCRLAPTCDRGERRRLRGGACKASRPRPGTDGGRPPRRRPGGRARASRRRTSACPGAVGRQANDRRSAGELAAPVGELRGEALSLEAFALPQGEVPGLERQLRKSTRLNSSHANNSYAVFC